MSMNKDVLRHTHNRLVTAWKYGVLAFIYTCALDWDHIWVWILDTVPPLVLYTPGRPFHTVVVFLVYAMVVSVGVVAFVVRRHNIIS